HSADQRLGTFGWRDRGALPQALANRAAVSMDKAAPQKPPPPRPLRKRRSPPDLCRHDRLFVAAHRRATKPVEPPCLALRRSGAKPPVRTQTSGPDRQVPAQLSTRLLGSKPTPSRLCLNFPGQPCACAGMTDKESTITTLSQGGSPMLELSDIQSSQEELQDYYAQLAAQHVTPAWIGGGITIGPPTKAG